MPGAIGAMDAPIVVTYACSPKKEDFFAQLALASRTIPGVTVVPADQLKGMRYDAILHKLTDEMVGAQLGRPHCIDKVAEFKRMLPDHVVQVDKVHGLKTLMDRAAMARSFEAALERAPGVSHAFRNLAWGIVRLDNINTNNTHHLERAMEAFNFPVIIKRRMACGTPESHHMAICYTLEDAVAKAREMGVVQNDVYKSLFVQEYVPNHGNVVFKLYNVGERVEVQPRGSIAGLTEFDSQTLSKCGKVLAPHSIDTKAIIVLPGDLARKIAASVRQQLDLDLFGMDVIFNTDTNKYSIIDVNYFPTFKNMKDVHRSIITLAMEKVRERRRLANVARIRYYAPKEWNPDQAKKEVVQPASPTTVTLCAEQSPAVSNAPCRSDLEKSAY